jgi:hypothetical protein
VAERQDDKHTLDKPESIETGPDGFAGYLASEMIERICVRDFDGIVTLSKKEGNKLAARAISSSRHSIAPCIDRRRAEGAVCSG